MAKARVAFDDASRPAAPCRDLFIASIRGAAIPHSSIWARKHGGLAVFGRGMDDFRKRKSYLFAWLAPSFCHGVLCFNVPCWFNIDCCFDVGLLTARTIYGLLHRCIPSLD